MYDVEYKNDIKLCPCKKCGADAVIENRPLMYWASCSKCGFSLRYFLNEDTAIRAWNDLNKGD